MDNSIKGVRKLKGDFAELMVAGDLRRRGYKLSIPFGEDCDYDLVIEREGKLERVQVKYAESDGTVAVVKCYSHSLTNGRIKATKRYTAATIEWLAVYDRTTNRCYYVPACELGEGRKELRLRVTPARNNQRAGIRLAAEYEDLNDAPPRVMEPAGLEPATSWMQTTRSPN